MADSTDEGFAVVIATTIALADQLVDHLTPDSTPDIPNLPANSPSPLILLETAAKSLKAQVTKVSLLSLTPPFTASALSTSFKPINESVLPSLVTATFLCSPDVFTISFAKEVKGLVQIALRGLIALTRLVEARSKDGQPKSEPSKAKKGEITEATGRVWEACETVIRLGEQGLPGYVVQKSKQWLDLMKDAVRELEEWDPNDDFEDEDPFLEAGSDHEPTIQASVNGTDDRATISAGVKDQALRVLSRIPQSIHVVVKQRLEKFRPSRGELLSKQTRDKLEYILTGTRSISDMLDEAAEGMYLGDPELALKKAGEARAMTIEIVEKAAAPLDVEEPGATRNETPEDKYIQRALEWIRRVDTKK